MAKNASLKRKVRAYMAQEGLKYTAAVREVTRLEAEAGAAEAARESESSD